MRLAKGQETVKGLLFHGETDVNVMLVGGDQHSAGRLFQRPHDCAATGQDDIRRERDQLRRVSANTTEATVVPFMLEHRGYLISLSVHGDGCAAQYPDRGPDLSGLQPFRDRDRCRCRIAPVGGDLSHGSVRIFDRRASSVLCYVWRKNLPRKSKPALATPPKPHSEMKVGKRGGLEA
jgi:hypothetical protein